MVCFITKLNLALLLGHPVQVHILPKHPHITKPTHTHTHTHTHPDITKQVKTTTVQDTHQTK
jgi:hypothetical protein